MLNRLEIQNFKGISKLDLKFKRINIIVGKNNTSKTSILESIDTLYNHDDKEMASIGRGRYFTSLIKAGKKEAEILGEESNSKSKLKLSIKHATTEEIVVDARKRLIEFLKDKEPFFGIEKNKKYPEMIDKIVDEVLTPELIKELKGLKVTNAKDEKIILEIDPEKLTKSTVRIRDNLLKKYSIQLMASFVIQAFFQPGNFFLGGPEDNKDKAKSKEAKLILDLRTNVDSRITPENEKKTTEIESYILANALVPGLIKFNLNFITYKDVPDPIPYAFMGDGFKAIIGMFWEYTPKLESKSTTKIFLLDEPEICMHPAYINELVKMLIKMAKEQNVQIVISTHSLDLINEFLICQEEREFLEKEFQIIKTNCDEKTREIITESFGFADAEQKDKLAIDLRGF